MLKPGFFITIAFFINSALIASECVVPELGVAQDKMVITEEDKVTVFAKDVEGTRDQFSLKSDVELHYKGQIIRTDIAQYNSSTGTFTTPNEVSLESARAQVNGLTADFDLVNRTANFKNAEFEFKDGTRGSAAELDLRETGLQTLKDVSFSTCPKNHTGWELIGPEIVLDQENQRGYGRNIRLEFANVPLFYLPYFSFPLNNKRKSGFLLPNIGTSGKSGFEFAAPYYWNIKPNLDLTTTPRLLTDRGIQLENEFRHLLPYSSGTVEFNVLMNDSQRDRTRRYFNWQNRLEFTDNWDLEVDIQDVSDDNYFIDFGGNLENTAITNLNREVSLGYFGNTWTVQALAQDYQVISPRITNFQEPYQRLPQINANAKWTNIGIQGLNLALDTEWVNFSRESGTEGLRANLFPQVQYQWASQAVSINSMVGLNLTQYALESTESLIDDKPTRSLPIVNLDARLHFERDMSGGLLPQTLEPRVQYTYIPYRDQSELPVFDTDLPDLTQNQLFSPWRFSGWDRIGDTHQIALGLSSRLLENENGQSLRFDLGQILYLDDRLVKLNENDKSENSSSLLVGEAFWRINQKWSIQSGLSWDSENNDHEKRNLAFSYQPKERTLLNMGYRSVKGSVDQTDIAFRYPVNDRINVVGRWNYDRLNKVTLDRYWGLEYDTCCWGIRAISRRYISDRDGNSDSAFLLQLELKGLSSVGARADRLLRESIFTDGP